MESSSDDLPIMGSSCSDSPLSELPNIRSWFPSYVYESFVLDTCDGFGDSVFNEDETEEDNRVVGEIGDGENFGGLASTRNLDDEKTNPNGETNNNLQPSAEISDSQFSSSFISEPPDVRNWFSSYTYESPVFGSIDSFEDSITSEVENEKFVIEDNIGDKKVNLRTFRQNKTYNKAYVPKEDNFLICESSFGGFKEDKNLSSEKSNLPQGANFPSLTVDSRNTDGKSPRKAAGSKDFAESSFSKELASFASTTMKSHSRLTQVDADSTTATWGRNEGASEGKHNSENGFVIMRKKNKPNDENSRPGEILLGCSKNKSMVPDHREKRRISAELDISNNSVEGRSVLAERSNFHSLDVIGTTGKWRCPQKSKPNIGPPMKQLRLERWVNRQ